MYIAALACLLNLCAGPDAALAQNAPFSATLAPSETKRFNDVVMKCEPTVVNLSFDQSSDLPPEDYLAGRGMLEAAFADCNFADGKTVRVKAGLMLLPVPYGQCGGAPPSMLSVWVNHRKVVSQYGYEGCSEIGVKSVKITETAIEICDLPQRDSPDEDRTAGAPPEPDICKNFDVSSNTAADDVEFPPPPAKDQVVDRLTVATISKPPGYEDQFADGPQGVTPVDSSICQLLIDPKDPATARVPAGVEVPAWTDVKFDGAPPDVSGLGYAATTFSEVHNFALRDTSTTKAEFDLENDGRVTPVYRHEEGSHWFHGSAFAREQPGILTTPFDVGDWKRSVASGIYPFNVEYGTIFFLGGKTYILLDPAALVEGPRVVMLHDHKAQTICTFDRHIENF